MAGGRGGGRGGEQGEVSCQTSKAGRPTNTELSGKELGAYSYVPWKLGEASHVCSWRWRQERARTYPGAPFGKSTLKDGFKRAPGASGGGRGEDDGVSSFPQMIVHFPWAKTLFLISRIL